MFGLNGLKNSLLDKYSYNRLLNNNAFNQSSFLNPVSNLVFGKDKPKWVEMSTPSDFEQAIRFNPIVKSALNLLATSASNGKKVLVDSVSKEVIPWGDKSEIVQKAHKLFALRPNPLQSAKEFAFQGVFYLKGYGNRYVYGLMPSGFDSKLDLMNVEVLYNLPSQFMRVKTTGKIYNQTDISGIISDYARVNSDPIEHYDPNWILHFNEVNVSSEQAGVLGISKLEVLKQPISNIQACFEAMNSILTARGMQGILSINVRDGQGANLPTKPQQDAVKEKFKHDYGLLNGQNQFVLTPVHLD